MLHWNSLCSHVAVFCLLFLGHSRHVCSQCAPPISGSWYRPYDSTTITFTGLQLRGHETTIGSVSPDDYSCWRSTGSKYVFRQESTVDGPLGPTRGYFCWQLVPLTSTTALLYQLTNIHGGPYFTNQRVVEGNVGDPDPSISDVCSLDSTLEYPSILYKVSSSSATDVDVATAPSARQNCPADVVATYNYQKGNQPCPDGVSQLDFCFDRQTARVDANCSDEILFSNDGVLSCLAHFTRGDTLFMILLNEDNTTTGTTTGTATRFACLEIEGAGSAVAYKGDCTKSTITASGTVNHTLSMTKTASCSTDDESGDDTDIVPIVVGVVVAVLIVIAVLGVFYILHRMGGIGCRERNVTPSTEGSRSPAATNSNPPAATNSNPPAATNSNPPAATNSNPPAATNSNPPAATNSNPPAATNSNPPAATNSNPPAATNSNPPAATNSNPPAATNSNPPAATNSNPPAATNSNPPAATNSNPPAATNSNPPAATNSNPPAATNSNPPAATNSNPPAGMNSNTPVATSSTTLAATSLNAPAAKSSKTPAAKSSKTPAAKSSKTPAAKSSKTPAAKSSKTPAAKSSKTPAAKSSNTPAATK